MGACECGCGSPAPIATRTDSRSGAVKGESRRFIRGHSGHRWQPGEGRIEAVTLPEDWHERVTLNEAGCWIWDRLNASGYGMYSSQRAHRLSYEFHVGQVPDGLVLDHTCHSDDRTCQGGNSCAHRGCINPDHLEPVTFVENVRRGRGGESSKRRAEATTHCPHGHEWTPENTKRKPRQRVCRECGRLASQRNNHRRRGVPRVVL